MAGDCDWMPIRVDLADDPAIIVTASACKIEQDAVVGKLVRLWAWANKHSTDGFVPAVTSAWIDDFVRRKGFGNALVSAGWIEFNEGGCVFPKFDRWNSNSAKARLQKNRRQADWRSTQASTAASTQASTAASTPPSRKASTRSTETDTEDQKQDQEQSTRASARPAGKTRLTSDWELPDAWRAWAKGERRDWDDATVTRVSSEYRDYWLSKGEARADWFATWRNWVRRERSPPTRSSTLAERRTSTLDQITGQNTGRKSNGRDITSTAERVDQPAISALAEHVRQPHGSDVGRG